VVRRVPFGAHPVSPAPHPRPRRDDTGRTLVSRQVAAYLGHLHVDQVRRAVPAVACDVATRAALVDLDQVEEHFAARRRRNRAALVPLRLE
jgi:hypothetical protein